MKQRKLFGAVLALGLCVFGSGESLGAYPMDDLLRYTLQEKINTHGLPNGYQDTGVYGFVHMDLDGDGVKELTIGWQGNMEHNSYGVYQIQGNTVVEIFRNDDLYLADATGPWIDVNRTATSGYHTGRHMADTHCYLAGWYKGSFQEISKIDLSPTEQAEYTQNLQEQFGDVPPMMGASFLFYEIIAKRVDATKEEILETETIRYELGVLYGRSELEEKLAEVGVSLGGTVVLPTQDSTSDSADSTSDSADSTTDSTTDSTSDSTSDSAGAGQEQVLLDVPQHMTTTKATGEAQYLEILQYYQDNYGTSNGSNIGLASSHLVDLDGNGTLELVLTLCPSTSPLALRMEVWEMIEGVATRTFVHVETQKFSTSEDWRDVGCLYSYNGGWIFYVAGGGGNTFFASFDRVFSYQNNSYQLIDETYLMRYPSSYGDSNNFVGYVTGVGLQVGSAKMVASAIPNWYSGFNRIQNQYFSGSKVELFYIEKSGYSWGTSSVKGNLEATVSTQTAQTGGEVVIPTSDSATMTARYKAYEEVLWSIENQHGTSMGLDEGLGFSYLVDMTGDGQQELVVGYCTKRQYFSRESVYVESAIANSNSFTLDIWQFNGESALKIHSMSQDSYIPGVDVSVYWNLVEENGKGTLMKKSTSPYGGDTIVYSYSNGSFTENINNSANFGGIALLSNVDASQLSWANGNCRKELATLLQYYSGSDHYYGNPVVWDGDLQASFESILPSSVKAMYEMDKDLYYCIAQGDSGQRGYVLGRDSRGDWSILQSGEGNLSAQDLQTLAVSFETGEVLDENGEIVESRDNDDDDDRSDRSDRTDDDDNQDMLELLAMGAVGLAGVTALALVVSTLKKALKKK